MWKRITAIVLMTIAFVISAPAQAPGDLISSLPDGRWTVETSLTFPIVRIYMAKASYRINQQSEVGIGVAFQNWRNEDEVPRGQSNAWTLPLAYRYYLWRGLHFEGELWPAYNSFESFVDERTYRGLELWAEYRIGYAVPLGQRLQLNLQPGIGHAVWMQNRWPGMDHDNLGELITSSLIFVPQVLVGWRL